MEEPPWCNTCDNVEKLQSEMFHSMSSSPDVKMIKSRVRWAKHVAGTGEIWNGYILVRTFEAKTPLGVSGCRCEDDTKRNLKRMRSGLAKTSSAYFVVGCREDECFVERLWTSPYSHQKTWSMY